MPETFQELPQDTQAQVTTELSRFIEAKHLLSKIIPAGGEPKDLDYLTTARKYLAAYGPINMAADALERLFVLGVQHPPVIRKYTDEFMLTCWEWQAIFLSRIQLDPNFIVSLRNVTSQSVRDFLSAFEKTF